GSKNAVFVNAMTAFLPANLGASAGIHTTLLSNVFSQAAGSSVLAATQYWRTVDLIFATSFFDMLFPLCCCIPPFWLSRPSHAPLAIGRSKFQHTDCASHLPEGSLRRVQRTFPAIAAGSPATSIAASNVARATARC